MTISPRARRLVVVLLGFAALLVIAAVWYLHANPTALFKDERFEFRGTNSQGFQEYRCRETDLEFVLFPGGSPVTSSDGKIVDSVPETFLLSKFEVTQDQWLSEMSSNPSPTRGGSLPVHGVSFEQAVEFCCRIRLQLPSYRDWLLVCQASSSGSRAEATFLETEWVRSNSDGVPHPVGLKQPNCFGLYDFRGNVAEWTIDPGWHALASDKSVSTWMFGGYYALDDTACRCDGTSMDGSSAWRVIGLRVAYHPQ